MIYNDQIIIVFVFHLYILSQSYFKILCLNSLFSIYGNKRHILVVMRINEPSNISM